VLLNLLMVLLVLVLRMLNLLMVLLLEMLMHLLMPWSHHLLLHHLSLLLVFLTCLLLRSGLVLSLSLIPIMLPWAVLAWSGCLHMRDTASCTDSMP
jgi:hypothetical protein